MISLGISFMFKTQVARNFFKLPSLTKPKPAEPTKDNAFKQYWKQYKGGFGGKACLATQYKITVQLRKEHRRP